MKFIGIVVTGVLLAGVASNAGATDSDPLTKSRAERLAIGVCASCHGARGNSQQPKYPRLAGQNANYLAAQLHAFKAQSRGDPDAIGYMWGMAANLDDAVITALANYYAAQVPRAGRAADNATLARGKVIFNQGVEAAGVPACASCHGVDAHGIADFPRLASQHSQYMLKQLNSFQSNLRDVAVMHGVAQGLKLADMRAVAAYLQAQP